MLFRTKPDRHGHTRLVFLLKRQVSEAMKRSQGQVVDYWRSQARKTLSKESAKAYQEGIQTDEVNTARPRADIAFSGKRPMLLEFGFGSFNMQPGFLRSPKAKVSVWGHRYLRIPITDDKFVTVSERYKGGWKHPGFRGVRLLPKVLDKAREVVTKELQKAVRGALR